jgi:hypothetical protein
MSAVISTFGSTMRTECTDELTPLALPFAAPAPEAGAARRGGVADPELDALAAAAPDLGVGAAAEAVR